MKTLLNILSGLKLCLTIPLQLAGAVIMLASILLFALATLIESPKMFKMRLLIVSATIKKIYQETKLKIKKEKYEKIV